MRKFLLTLIGLIVIVGVIGGVWWLGYRVGYKQGAGVAIGDNPAVVIPRGNDFDWGHMPRHEFGIRPDRGLPPGFGPRGFRMMPYGIGFGFFSPVRLILQLAIVGFVIWLLYELLTGWRLSFTRPTPATPRVEPAQPAETEARNTEEQGN